VTAPSGHGVYRRLLRCYPRSFRDEYGSDMERLLADQLDDERALRVWLRALTDLVLTVPTRHLEVHMARTPSMLVPILFASVGVAGVTVAVVIGTHFRVAAAALAIGVSAAILAIAAARSNRPVAAPAATTAQWWKLVAIGIGALAVMIVGEGATNIDLWMPMVMTVFAALLLIAAGVVLGLAHLVVTISHARRGAG
jgi:uncharacterized membrane protein YphA (DoxX/SURF4 family)